MSLAVFYVVAWVVFLCIPMMDDYVTGSDWLSWAVIVTVIWGLSVGITQVVT